MTERAPLPLKAAGLAHLVDCHLGAIPSPSPATTTEAPRFVPAPGLPPPEKAAPGAASGLAVRYAAGALVWVLRHPLAAHMQAGRNEVPLVQWHPARVERPTRGWDSRVQLVSFAPPQRSESVALGDVQPHGDGWENLQRQSLAALATIARFISSSRAGGFSAPHATDADGYTASVKKLLQAAESDGSGVKLAFAKANRLQRRDSGGTGGPLTVGGEPCVVLDPQSRIAMKLRHRVLGKLVEAIRPPSETAPILHKGAIAQHSSSAGGSAYNTSTRKANAADAAAPIDAIDARVRADERLILRGREIELRLYRDCRNKSEYHNRAISEISGLRRANAAAFLETEEDATTPTTTKTTTTATTTTDESADAASIAERYATTYIYPAKFSFVCVIS